MCLMFWLSSVVSSPSNSGFLQRAMDNLSSYLKFCMYNLQAVPKESMISSVMKNFSCENVFFPPLVSILVLISLVCIMTPLKYSPRNISISLGLLHCSEMLIIMMRSVSSYDDCL
jgi:hypothetical protein